jgi:hypothetical protein
MYKKGVSPGARKEICQGTCTEKKLVHVQVKELVKVQIKELVKVQVKKLVQVQVKEPVQVEGNVHRKELDHAQY